jgi:hypothetical protein
VPKQHAGEWIHPWAQTADALHSPGVGIQWCQVWHGTLKPHPIDLGHACLMSQNSLSLMPLAFACLGLYCTLPPPLQNCIIFFNLFYAMTSSRQQTHVLIIAVKCTHAGASSPPQSPPSGAAGPWRSKQPSSRTGSTGQLPAELTGPWLRGHVPGAPLGLWQLALRHGRRLLLRLRTGGCWL